MIEQIIYGPADWLVEKFSARDRRAFGFWLVIFASIGAVFFGRILLYVTILSVIALVPVFLAETPVEKEEI